MASFNKITIVGYLGKDVETRYLPDGTAVGNFSVATTEKMKKGGESHELTTWFRVSVFGKLAEVCAQYLQKGSQVYLEGRLSQQEFSDRDGNKRTSREVKASEVQFLGAKPQGEARDGTGSKSFSTDKQGRVVSPPMDDDDPNMPF